MLFKILRATCKTLSMSVSVEDSKTLKGVHDPKS